MKHALVTGGTGGIGAAVVHQLVNRGYCVAVTGRRLDALHALESKFGKECIVPFPCDLNTQHAPESLAKSVSKAFPRVDVVVLAAGQSQSSLLIKTDEQIFDQMFRINCQRQLMLVRHLIRTPSILQHQSCSFVAIGSVVGERGNAGQVAYSASKGALSAAFKSLAKEFGSRNLRFNIVAPGLIDTEMTRSISVPNRAAFVQQTALQRSGSCEEIAQAVLMCVECTYMTGEVVNVNGGM